MFILHVTIENCSVTQTLTKIKWHQLNGSFAKHTVSRLRPSAAKHNKWNNCATILLYSRRERFLQLFIPATSCPLSHWQRALWLQSHTAVPQASLQDHHCSWIAHRVCFNARQEFWPSIRRRKQREARNIVCERNSKGSETLERSQKEENAELGNADVIVVYHVTQRV
jgi:hypothetical protein